MRAVLLDMDGVLYEGDRAVTGAASAVSWLRERAVPHIFLTNTTSCPRTALASKLASLGIETTADRILPPAAALGWLRANAPGPRSVRAPGKLVQGGCHVVDERNLA